MELSLPSPNALPWIHRDASNHAQPSPTGTVSAISTVPYHPTVINDPISDWDALNAHAIVKERWFNLLPPFQSLIPPPHQPPPLLPPPLLIPLPLVVHPLPLIIFILHLLHLIPLLPLLLPPPLLLLPLVIMLVKRQSLLMILMISPFLLLYLLILRSLTLPLLLHLLLSLLFLMSSERSACNLWMQVLVIDSLRDSTSIPRMEGAIHSGERGYCR